MNQPYEIFKYGSNGSEVWGTSNPDFCCGPNTAYGLAVDNTGNAFVTGQIAPPTGSGFSYGTYRVTTNGLWAWTNCFPLLGTWPPSSGTSIALDSANSVYVTGYSLGSNSFNDIVTIKYSNDSNQIWLQRYSSPSDGNAAGNAIAVDNNGNVYVTGYDTTAAGGTEIVTIKYSPVTLQRRSDGTVILKAQGSAGESFDFLGSADLINWLDLGSVIANSNGLAQFQDTNASNYNARFYHTNPQ